ETPLRRRIVCGRRNVRRFSERLYERVKAFGGTERLLTHEMKTSSNERPSAQRSSASSIRHEERQRMPRDSRIERSRGAWICRPISANRKGAIDRALPTETATDPDGLRNQSAQASSASGPTAAGAAPVDRRRSLWPIVAA